MWLVLCHSTDRPALWAYEQLIEHGLAPVELVTAEVLSCAVRCEHRLTANTQSVDITLADGRRIESAAVRGTLNRIHYPAVQHLSVVAEEEREYAAQELQAFYLGWLYSLPAPMLNVPTPQGLSGQWRFPTEWNVLASQAGLVTRSMHVSSREYDIGMFASNMSPENSRNHHTIFCVAGDVIGDHVPVEVATACRSLAKASGTALLGLEFELGDRWTFLNASVSPNLSLGGQPLIASLVSLFSNRSPCYREDAR